MTPARFARLRAVLDRRQPDLTVLAEDVHKSHNISAVLRSCDAVGVTELHAVSPGGQFARHRMISGGSRKWVRTRSHPDIETATTHLKRQYIQIVAAHFSGQSIDYRDWDYTQPTAILLGAELTGVSPAAAALADRHIKIPMRGLVASLNVSVAAAVILYEAALDAVTYEELLFEWSYPTVARLCQEKGLPYPALDGQGFIARPELSSALRAPHRRPRKDRHT
ncbi:MAG: tRNA (guanosine(18)-2'-O)-methyltransferase TrmH [Gammaproteobacteria bacterium]|nr:tRNA (guanosine(18)-2'-O)-methyltransferase TrmH [Gammaproteobacteria bacterium]